MGILDVTLVIVSFIAAFYLSKKIHSTGSASEVALQETLKRFEAEKSLMTADMAAKDNLILGLNRSVSILETKNHYLEESVKTLQEEKNKFQSQYEVTLSAHGETSKKAATLEAQLRAREEQIKHQKENFEEVLKQSKIEFENLANQILETKSKSFSEQNEKNMDTILKPLKEKIQSFEASVDLKYNNESKERFALKNEIEKLIGLNEKMTNEAHLLTQALKGDSKVQGDWGEQILERVLEASGLQEGREYSIQETLLSDDGSKFRPDVIINLPDNKHIIVDSKVSLTNYEQYYRATTEDEREIALNLHVKSISKHIDDLSSKDYFKLKGINSPEFVFLFIPIEPAFLLAIQKDSELSSKAWSKRIAIVTSSTLFTSLRTVSSIWKVEKQNRNALEIASEGAKMYDKFVGFLEDFQKVGKTFETGTQAFQSAMNKLKDGNGSVFKKMELLRELGASPMKKIAPDLLE